MKNRVQSLWFLSALALFLSVGISLNAATNAADNNAGSTGTTTYGGSACATGGIATIDAADARSHTIADARTSATESDAEPATRANT